MSLRADNGLRNDHPEKNRELRTRIGFSFALKDHIIERSAKGFDRASYLAGQIVPKI